MQVLLKGGVPFYLEGLLSTGLPTLGKPLQEKIAFLWIFAGGGGGRGVKPESKASKELFEEPFFSLSLDIFKEEGGGSQVQTF